MTKGWAVLTAAMGLLAVVGGTGSAARAEPLSAESFLYQMRNVDLAAVAASPYRVVVLDPSRDGTPAGAWTPQEIADLRAAGKTVLAVVRVGEADSSLAYWDPAWVDDNFPELRPDWLGPEDPERPGFYRVQYWKTGWQQMLVGAPLGVIDGVIAQGFDGVVLEAVNAYQYWGPEGKLPSGERNANADTDMKALVAAIAAYTRTTSGNPGFAVVQQNAAGLLADDDHLALLSGVVAESTWFLGDKRQKTSVTRTAVPYLDRVIAAGKPVFALEYPSAGRFIDIAYDRAESKGYTPLVTTAARDILVLNPDHPPGLPVAFAPQSPAHNADAYPDQIPLFTWGDGGASGLSYRIRLSGSESRQQVYTFPKTGVLHDLDYQPKGWEWRGILRLARSNNSGAVYWWVTTVDANGVARSSKARTLYRMHSEVTTTIFWVGAPAGQTSSDSSREQSAWDADWVTHFGGVDDPLVRSTDPLHPYWPEFTPLENPFYLALPYNDFSDSGSRRPNYGEVVPWARFASYGPLESAVKNRWVKITRGAATCYGQWEDVGPSQSYDFRYVFGTSKPRNKLDLGAGLEVSPALRQCLGIDTIGGTNWRFVFDEEPVPDGPWKEIVTTSQVTP